MVPADLSELSETERTLNTEKKTLLQQKLNWGGESNGEFSLPAESKEYQHALVSLASGDTGLREILVVTRTWAGVMGPYLHLLQCLAWSRCSGNVSEPS